MAPQLTLYGSFISSSTSRVRLGLALRQIPYTFIPVSIDPSKLENQKPEYVERNPSRSVPTLTVSDTANPPQKFNVTQSIAALEYLEEAFPDSKPYLLPRGTDSQTLAKRALIRSLTAIVVADIQPVSSITVMGWVSALGKPPMEWAKDVHVRGLTAYEGLLRATGCEGKFSVGDAVSLADVVLVPAIWNAQKASVDLEQFPLVSSIFAHLSGLEAVDAELRSRQGNAA